MKKLNNLHNYDEFVEIKEGAIWNAIKGLFNAIFATVSKKTEQSINNFTKKIENAKTWKDIQRVVADDVIVSGKEIDAALPTANDLIDIRKIHYDICASEYIKAADLSKKTGDDNLKPSVFFDDVAGYEKVFNYETVKDFYKNLPVNVNEIVAELATTAKYPKEDIEAMKKAPIEKEIQTEKPAEQTAQKPAEQTTQKPAEQTTGQQAKANVKQDQSGLNDSIINTGEKLFEAEDPAPAPAPTAPAAQPAKGNIEALRTDTKNKLTNLLTIVSKKYQDYKFEGNLAGGNTVGNMANYTGKDAKGKVITTHLDTVKKMAQTMRGLNMDQLKAVRQAQAKAIGKDPMKDIGPL